MRDVTAGAFNNAQRSAVVAIQQVDTILDFHSQTPGTQYGFNPASDAWGNTAWDVYAGNGVTNKAMFTNCIGPDFTYAFPVQTFDGHIATSSGTNWIQGDLGNNSGFMALRYSWFPGASRAEALDYFCISNLSASGQSSRDLSLHNDNPALIAQFNLWDSQSGGTKIKSGIHSFFDTGQPSFVGNLPGNTYISRELTGDLTNGFAFVTYRYATNNAFIFSSITYAEPRAELQGLYQAEDGYIYINPNSGLDVRGGIRLFYGANVPSNRPPWAPNIPTGVSANQTGSGIAGTTWTDPNFMLNSNRVSYSNGTDGESVVWAQPQNNTATITGLTATHTYDVRVQAYFRNNVKTLAATTTLTITNWPTPITNGLVLRWLLNENSGTAVLDHWTNGYNGNIQGTTPTWALVAAPTNYAAVLNGTDNYLIKTSPFDDSPVQAPPFTVSMWVSNSTAGHILTIFSGNTSLWDGWLGGIDTSSGTANLYTIVNHDFTDVGGGGAHISFTPSAGWHHLVFVVTSSSSKDVWVDGVQGTTDTGTYVPSQGGYRFAVGANVRQGIVEFFANGLVNDVQLFNRALTSTEIQYLFNKGADGPPE